MKLIIISGRSGSGKSTALRALEDEGYNCIDNFPVSLLQALVHNAVREGSPDQHMAVCIDARNRSDDLERFPELLLSLDRMDLDCQIIFLDAISDSLVKRFSETRRRHPLTDPSTDLRQAIEQEREILQSISDLADLTIDTTQLSAQRLIELIKVRIVDKSDLGISLLFRSFGFKGGVPVDADFVFDIRCLPNPFWIENLRNRSGRDVAVIAYLDDQSDAQSMYADILTFLESWLPKFEQNHRVYMTVAIGCTGGQHRSVYMVEKLARHFQGTYQDVLVRHREIDE